MNIDTQKMNVKKEYHASLVEQVKKYRQELSNTLQSSGYKNSQDSIKLPLDDVIRTQAHKLAETYAGTKLVVVIGIGGSNLGTKAVYEALGLPVRMEFIDTVDPLNINRVWAIMSLYTATEVVVCSVSKSGSTTETITNTEIIFARMQQLWGEDLARERLLVISDEQSDLYITAKHMGVQVVAHEQVGGRYSIFSSVGLVPLAIAGCDINSLHAGAAEMVGKLNGLAEEDEALHRAQTIYQQYQVGRRVHNLFVFNPELTSVGAWYRQLVGESLGKKHNLDGKEVHTGIVPTIAVGSTDLHSMAQLYLADPEIISTTFIYSPREGVKVPEERAFSNVVPMISGKSTQSIMDAIYQGTTTAYANNKIPFSEIKLDEVSAHEIGALLQMQMIEVMYLAHLMQVDAFNQPSVEDYKVVTKKILDT